MKYKTAKEKAISELGEAGPPVQPVYVWFAYKEGKFLGDSTISREDAEKKYDTKVVEKVMINTEDVNHHWTHARHIEQRASEIWRDAMRNEYGELNDKVFNLCMAQAYDRGHSSGHDEVAMHMDEIVDFVHKVLEAVE